MGCCQRDLRVVFGIGFVVHDAAQNLDEFAGSGQQAPIDGNHTAAAAATTSRTKAGLGSRPFRVTVVAAGGRVFDKQILALLLMLLRGCCYCCCCLVLVTLVVLPFAAAAKDAEGAEADTVCRAVAGAIRGFCL